MANPTGKDDVTITVGVENNEAQFKEVLSQMEVGFDRVIAKITSQLGAEFGNFAKQTGKHIDDVSPKIKNAAKQLNDLGNVGEDALKGIDKQLASLLTVLTQFNRSASESVGAMATIREGNRRLSVETTARSQDVARQQVEATRAASHAHTVETQRVTTQERSAALERIQFAKNEGRLAVVAAQKAAKTRVLITQAALQTIGRLEKGLGVTLAGAARAASTAFSKIFEGISARRGGGIAGAVEKQNAELSSELRHTNSIVETNTHQINNSFTEGTSTSLNKRERLIRESFREQETIVRQSALRQKAVFEELRASTQTGVVGAANRGLNIGAFLGGAAIFTAARSTFGVGSEFVRGLAVLQAQLDLTGEEMKTVRQLSIDLGNDITLPGVSALDAAEAIQLLSKQFAALGDGAIKAAEDASKGTLQLSRAANVGAEEAAGVVGSAVNVFGISASKATDVADQVTAALKNAAGVGFGDFADAFKQAGAVFAQFQVPAVGATDALLEFDTALAVIARSGVVGSDAGTSLKQFFLQATRQAPAAKKALAELTDRAGESGSAFFDAAGKARPFEKTLDILRKGLKGYNDQQRTTALGTIFGSDAIRVANALLSTSTEEYAKVTQALREQGLAAKIAAAQNTGFKGALDALGSTLETAQILLFEQLNPILSKVTLGFAALFTNILQGKGAWSIVRRGLLGIAAGLGAVLAVKGVVELFGLLETALGLLLTPMGAFLVAAAGIGAAISILSDKSPAFRDALSSIRDVLVDLGKKGVELAGRGLKNLGDIIARDVLPFLESVGRVIGGKVVDAFKFLSGFVTDTVIPALKKLADVVERNAVKGWNILVRFFENRVIPAFKLIVQFVEKSILPKLKELAGFVGRELVDAFKILVDFLTGSVYPAIFGLGLAFGPIGVAIAGVTSAIIFFWDSIRPVLQPAIDGFKTLGDAVSTAFKLGDLSGVGAGLSAAGSGIAKVASTIGGLIVDVLAAAGRAIVDGLKEVFSLAHLIAAGKGFLDFVEFVGNTLGKIVTNPKFVAAVTAIGIALAAGAGLVVFRFLEGFSKAFLHNLPGLIKLLGAALLLALAGAVKFAVTNPALSVIIFGGLVALFEARLLFKAISAAGEKAGGGFMTGFAKSVKTSARNSVGTLAGFFGQQARTIGPAEQSAGFFKQQIDQMVKVQRSLRALGSTTIVQLNPKSLEAANQELQNLMANTSEARLRGLLLRDSFVQVGTGLKTAFTGIAKTVGGAAAGVVRGVVKAFTDTNVYAGGGGTAGKGFIKGFRDSIGREGTGQIKAGFTQAMTALRDAAVTGSTSIGKLIATGLVKGVTAGVLAIGTFQGGKAEGAAGGSGLLSALLGGLTTTAVLGGPENPVALAAGVATAGLGLLGAELGKSEAKAKAFREEVNKLSSAFNDDLITAIEDGTLSLKDFADNKVDLSSVLGLGDNFKETIKSVGDALSGDQLTALNDAFGSGSISKVVGLLQEANGDVDKFNASFTAAFLDSAAASKKFVDTFGADANDVKKIFGKILEPGGDKTLKDFLDDHVFDKSAAVNALRNNKAYAASIVDTSNKVTDEGKAIVEATKKSVAYAQATAVVPGKANLLTTSAANAVTAANNAIETAGQLVGAASGHLTDLQQVAVNTFRKLVNVGTPIDVAQQKLADLHLPPVPQSEIDAFTTHLNDVATSAQAINDQLDHMPDAFAAAINAANGVASTVTVDQAVLGSTTIATSIQDALTKGPNSVIGSAELADATRNAGAVVGKALAGGVASGAVVDEATARTFAKPIQDAMIEALGPRPTDDPAAAKVFDESVAQIKTIFENGLSAVKVVIDEQTLDQQIKDFMATHPQVLAIDAAKSLQFLNTLNTDQGFLREGDLRRFGGAATFAGGTSGAQRTPVTTQNITDTTTVNIYETKDPRATARSTIAALRADRLLQHGVR